jgi:hypothetical protein
MGKQIQQDEVKIDHKYDVWKNFMLILCGILVGTCFSSYDKIYNAINSLGEFDKTLNLSNYSIILSLLFLFYILKNAHGILITLFDNAYYKKLVNNEIQIVLFFIFTSLIVVSFSLVLYLIENVHTGNTFYIRGGKLILYSLFPTIIFLVFDFIHYWFLFQTDIKTSDFKEVLHEPFSKKPSSRHDHKVYKMVWLFEDIISLILILTWFLIVFNLNLTPSFQVIFTTIVFGTLLIINTFLDYILNFNYFFKF